MKYLPESGENLFQRIKRIVREYESKNWQWSSINIAVWEPDLNPPETLRKITAEYVLKNENWIHTYWDNRASEDFIEWMFKHHTWLSLNDYSHLKWLALPWEKAMLWLLPIACWSNINKSNENIWFIRTVPAYDLIWQWSEYLWQESYILPLYSSDNFRVRISNLPKLAKPPRMILTVKPWNPCPVWWKVEEWKELIEYCIANNVRLVNDWAYAWLNHWWKHTSLSLIAKDYKNLDWMELFSISKTMNACWWRIWVAVWSIDFIDELAKIKWNSDSWAFGPALVWVSEYLKHQNSKGELQEINDIYKKRASIMIPAFEKAWFKLACNTEAWFFVLWKCPRKLDWENIETSEEFNNKMISKIWLVWVPFIWAEIDWKKEQFIRYTVCSSFEDEKFAKRVSDALDKVKVEY